MKATELRGLVLEARRAMSTFEAGSEPSRVASLVVSGVLAEQLARELSAGARTGSVVVGDEVALRGAAVAVRVIAGDPSAEDISFVEAADDALVPVVLVQLWPQEDWRKPFVLTPFVVECEAGKGFPIAEIAARIAGASDEATGLAARLPALAPAVEHVVVRAAAIRAALLAAFARTSGSRSVLVLEEVRLFAQLRAMSERPAPDPPAVAAGVAAGSLAIGFALRSLARRSSRVAPTPLANAAVAGLGTWVLARIARELDARLPRE